MKRWIDAVRGFGQALLLLILAGCTVSLGAASPESAVSTVKISTPAPATAPRAAAAGRLFVTGAEGYDVSQVFVLDAASGAPQLTLPAGYISPDWSTLYQVAPVQDQTAIRAYDLATGRMLRETTVPGLYDVPAPPEDPRQSAFSPDGRWLALIGLPTPAEEQAWNDGKAPPTRLLVVDTSFSSPPRHIDLAGYFWFDTLGPGGSLYLIEVLDNSAGHAPRYQVRRYDLGAGRLDDQPVADKREPGPMNGNRRTAVPSADGTWLYSLYTRDTEGPFVHVLNLNDRYAICVDLPFPAGGSDAFESELLWSLALSPDGRTLYAVNALLGQVSAIDTESFEVRSATFPKAAAQAPDLLAQIGRWLMPVAEAKRLVYGGAVVSPDGQTLYAVDGAGLVAIATGDLTVRGRYMPDWTFSSLAVSPDGAALYAANAEKPAILRLALPLSAAAAAPDQIATPITPKAIMRIIAAR